MTADTGDKSAGWVPPMEIDPGRAAPLASGEEAALLSGAGDPAVDLLPVAVAVPRPRRRLGLWLAGAVAALVVVALGFDTADLLMRAFATSVALGVLVGVLAAVAVVAAAAMLIGELLSLRRLRRIEELRAEAGRLELEVSGGRADRFAGSLVSLYADRPELAPALARVRDHVTDAHDEHEVVRLLDREVLAPLDRAAYQRVMRASRDTAIATALSPAALLDFAVVLWRNLKLVREIAALYGARPGYVGSLRLLRRMLANIAVAGVTESAHHVAVEALGGSLAAAISTRMGQGMINGLLTARVGLTAMHLCRPIAFGPDNRPSLNRIRKELLTLPKQVL
ncbi:TIGR01620 family protein [Azospirillum picis]|uniref:Membrane protein n=1 Tax=Azospirillum picis TaxID=488438 RepID=A0ABU0MMA1_9PROT|nr:TIGR01620 family protein [Azospirillum picis]MBP2300629.1 putative membrane protein [Azospirillum picis]MDQ0534598.1 putative membrane protein [Azospirillum picis]